MANEILIKEKTTLTFDTTTTPALTLTSLGSAAGRVSAIKDLGAATYPRRYVWRLKTKFASAPAEGRVIEVYIAYSNDASGTIQDGAVGTANAALSSVNQRFMCQLVGHAYCRNVTTALYTSGVFEIRGRYISVVVYNDTDQALSGTAGDHKIELMPIAEEVQ